MNIWTNGCYDIVHFGHMKLFEYAKSLGDNLFVGIDSDDRVKERKGFSRPVNNQFMRKYFLQGIRYVDGVHIFYSDIQLEKLIKNLDITYIVIGDEYKDTDVIGSKYAKVLYFPKINKDSLSTSNIIKKIL
jgi:D-beta-D-heptose 7-phosphate kinase/D-beta-D-heptose 1-phosphate adenosyltransferase